MNRHNGYESSLSSRNASAEMQSIWSTQFKFSTWRRLWLALAEAEKELGLPISDEQVEQMRQHLDDIDYDTASEFEKKMRHDVMAHIHTFGKAAPKAAPIIHLGATSQFVNCNTELIQIRDALQLVAGKLANAIDALAQFAHRYKSLPTLGFTHYQPAQPTTVGKRASLWAHELAIALEETEHRLQTLRYRGAKGTTGTQASYLALFSDADDPDAMVEKLDSLVTQNMGWPPDKRFVVTGQTYPRILDALVAATVGSIGAACAKFATDVRLLANRKELEEPAEREQVGSTAMAYKRNPARCERICGLCRFVIGQTQIPFTTAAEQWFERTLDDSSCRRLSLPEPFLAIDGALDLVINVARGLVVYETTIAANLAAELPFMATENLIMAAVKQGANRQEVHEIVRRHSRAAGHRIKSEAAPNDLLERLQQESVFASVDLDAVLDPNQYIGRAPRQVETFLATIHAPIVRRYEDSLGYEPEIHV